MSLHVVWNSVSWRTLAQYDKTRLISSTAIDWHRLYREMSWYMALSAERALLPNCKWRPCCLLPFYRSELQFLLYNLDVLPFWGNHQGCLWHLLFQASLFSVEYSQPWPFLCLRIYIQTIMRIWKTISCLLCIFAYMDLLKKLDCHARLVTTAELKASFYPHGYNSSWMPLCLEAPSLLSWAQEPSGPAMFLGLGVAWPLLSQGMLVLTWAQPHHHHLPSSVHPAAP